MYLKFRSVPANIVYVLFTRNSGNMVMVDLVGEEYLSIRYSLSSISCVIRDSHPKIHLLPDLRLWHTNPSELWT